MPETLILVNTPGSMAKLHAAVRAVPGILGGDGQARYTITQAANGIVHVRLPDDTLVDAVQTAVIDYDREYDPTELTYDDKLNLNTKLRTTNATATEIFRGTLRQRTLYVANLRLLAVDAANGDSKYMEARIVVKRLVGGALMVGAPEVPVNIADPGASAWTVTAPVSGNDSIIRVTGAASRNIDWWLQGVVESFSPAGYVS